MNCPTCGTAMQPLFTGEFCPNDCDLREPRPTLTVSETEVNWALDFIDPWGDVDTKEFCPGCLSSDTEPFHVQGQPDIMMHCNVCGRVW